MKRDSASVLAAAMMAIAYGGVASSASELRPDEPLPKPKRPRGNKYYQPNPCQAGIKCGEYIGRPKKSPVSP